MALAKYFSKDLLAINRIINTKHSLLEERLNETIIAIAFDENAINTQEGCHGLDLITRLISRLYPKLEIISLTQKGSAKKDELINLAREINSKIEIVSGARDLDVCIVAGACGSQISIGGQRVHFGSDNWVAKYSTLGERKFGTSENPCGVGLSASIAASNVFRYIFKDYLEGNPLDEEFELSAFSLGEEYEKDNPVLKDVKLDDVAIVGIGAIGNGAVWALSKLMKLEGKIVLIDNEKVALSNLQRYLLCSENDEGRKKVVIAKEFFQQDNLEVEPFEGKWDEYLGSRNDWNINCVAIGVDNWQDRVKVQSSLPKVIFNSFTEPESIGVSRHLNFTEEPCVACSYIPTEKKKNFINEVADNCNIHDKSEMVKDYFNLSKSVDDIWPPKYNESLLSVIAQANKIDIAELSQFNGMMINEFYSKFVCGGVILQLSKEESDIQNVDAPLAFQSAMAGILLAIELVKYFNYPGIRQQNRTDFYHLAPIREGYNPYHRILEKDITMRCFCRDEDFLKRYQEKWPMPGN